jgi:hypothetical protein
MTRPKNPSQNMASKRRITKKCSVSAGASQEPSNLSLSKSRIGRRTLNRSQKSTAHADAIADAVDTGFKKIDRIPAEPTTELGHLTDWKRPRFPADKESREKLIDTFMEKLKLVRNVAVEEFNVSDTEIVGCLLKKKRTSENPVARIFADPEQPLPISFPAQDLIRLYLYEIATIRELENATPKDKATKYWKWAFNVAIAQRNHRWNGLVDILQMQLPGKERERKERMIEILQDVLQKQLKLTMA